MQELHMHSPPRQTPHRLDRPEPAEPLMDANQAAIALATAMNEARTALAGREEAAQDARAAGVARLQALRAKLAPLYAAIPREVEMFDLGFVAPDKPRLFVDIIAYVEPGRDGAGYRFVQESRSGRAVLLETQDEAELIREITRYVARRLVARERALTLEGGEQPARLLRQPAPMLPLTAEEAFRQWTRGGRSQGEAAPSGEPERTEKGASTVEASTPQAGIPEAAAPSAPTATGDVQAGPVVAGARPPAESAPHIPSQAPQQKVQPRAAGARRWPEASPRRERAAGSWFWPLLALLIGVGLGALALYLYAASLPA